MRLEKDLIKFLNQEEEEWGEEGKEEEGKEGEGTEEGTEEEW